MGHNELTSITSLHTSDLTVISELGKSDYLLSDGKLEYGRLRKFSSSSIERFIDVCDKTFKLQSAAIPPKYKLILNNNDEVIGKITFRKWGVQTDIEFKDGLQACFTKTPGSGFFSTKMSWVTNDKELLRIADKFSLSKQMVVTLVDANVTKQGHYLPLLALIGIDILLTTRQRSY